MTFVKRKEVAKFFAVSERTLDRWIKRGILRAHKFGISRNSAVRIPKSEVNKFLQKHKKNVRRNTKNK